MGLDPNKWGPKGWFFLHSIALNYPQNPTNRDKQNYKIFFESLQHVLPCQQCAIHYSNNIKNNPIDDFLNDNISINKWLVNIHNIVNKLNDKPELSYNEFLTIYKNIYNNVSDCNIYIYLIVAFVLLIVSFYLYKRFKQ